MRNVIMRRMADIFSKKKRSEIMSRIKSKLTKVEERGWATLKLAGIRFRKHPTGIVGRPDAGNKSKKLAVFFDSEFWHGHDWERRKKTIKSNRKFWLKKIERNIARDKQVNALLRKSGWKVVRIWQRDLAPRRLERTVSKLKKLWEELD